MLPCELRKSISVLMEKREPAKFNAKPVPPEVALTRPAVSKLPVLAKVAPEPTVRAVVGAAPAKAPQSMPIFAVSFSTTSQI